MNPAEYLWKHRRDASNAPRVDFRWRHAGRSLVALVAALSLFLPTLFSLWAVHPEFILGDVPEPLASAGHRVFESEQGSALAGEAAIPGSPTHPRDHHCLSCQLLKLAAAVVASPPPVLVDPGSPRYAARRGGDEPQCRSRAACVPPSRGPPTIL